METGIADRIPELLRVLAASYEQPIIGYGLSLLYWLVAIELAWAFARLVLARDPLEAFVEESVRQIMIVGLFVFLITNGAWLAETIIPTFQPAGAGPGGSAMSPSAVIEKGVTLFTRIWNGASPSFDVIPRFFSALAVLLACVWIAVNIVVVLAESYIVAAGAALLLGFGGATWMRDFFAFVRYVFSVGVKLFVLQMLVTLTSDVVSTVHAAPITSIADAAVAIGVIGVLAWMVHSIPGIAQSFISGASVSTAASAIAAPAVAAGGELMASLNAARAASAAVKGSENPPASIAGRIGETAIGTAGNLAAQHKQQEAPGWSGRVVRGPRDWKYF